MENRIISKGEVLRKAGKYMKENCLQKPRRGGAKIMLAFYQPILSNGDLF